MKRKAIFFIACACALLAPSSGHAIVTSNNATAEQAPSGLIWDYVYKHPDVSAVAVDRYWIITAAHVADYGGPGTLTIGGTNYLQQEIVYHESADLALIRYDKELPGYYPLYTGTFPTQPPSLKLSVILVGYGYTGTVSSASWTDSGSGRGTKRWGSQKIDSTQTVSYDVGGITGWTTNSGFWMDFDLGNTAYEAGVGVYDSGGGTFYNDSGTWKLAGINTQRNGTAPNYTSTFAVSVPAYEPWIAQNIPEPGTAMLLVGCGVVFGAVKRFRHLNR
ncbi:MAG: trypsin-like serine protease [Kiritimatiellaeota bacterium]|nr:trypsin-like serine protease [Kiritimatiellota bacterium]